MFSILFEFSWNNNKRENTATTDFPSSISYKPHRDFIQA